MSPPLAEDHREILRSISSILSRNEPTAREPYASGGVALILARSPEGEKLLLILRPAGGNDPWAGQVALPGGRVKEEDQSFEGTAIRETKEEVGVDLIHENFLGYLGKFLAGSRAGMGGIPVVPSVFVSESVPAVTQNQEVASYRWIPLRDVVDPKNRTRHILKRDDVSVPFPALMLGDYLVWGVTERILTTMVEAIRKDIPGA
jgi:8-oxo-dGTP pyrophosphatase MutT (NUDIX family)